MIRPRTPSSNSSAGLVAIQAGALLLVGLLTPISSLWTWGGDLLQYQDVGRLVLSGSLPYRDFPFEYPPLAILPMAVPALVAPAEEAIEVYRWLFLIQNMVLGMCIAGALALVATRTWGRGASVVVLIALVLPWVAISPMVAWRYDILVGVLLAAAIVADGEDRPGLAGVALGLGAMTKVYPAFLVPVFLVRHIARGERLEAVRLTAAFLLTVSAIMLPFLLAAGSDALQFVAWQLERGVQIESVAGGLTIFSHLVLGTPVDVTYAFNSQQLVSPLADALATISQVVLVGLLAALLAFGYRSLRAGSAAYPPIAERLLTLLLAALLAVIVTNKVLSPQYLVWLLPLAAFRPLREAGLLAGICVLTILIFPLNYERLVQLEPGMIILLNVRNGLLVAWLSWLTWLTWLTWRTAVGDPSPNAEPVRA